MNRQERRSMRPTRGRAIRPAPAAPPVNPHITRGANFHTEFLDPLYSRGNIQLPGDTADLRLPFSILLHNAYCAGATKVLVSLGESRDESKPVTVSDNGEGCSDFHKLVKGESGWTNFFGHTIGNSLGILLSSWGYSGGFTIRSHDWQLKVEGGLGVYAIQTNMPRHEGFKLTFHRIRIRGSFTGNISQLAPLYPFEIYYRDYQGLTTAQEEALHPEEMSTRLSGGFFARTDIKELKFPGGTIYAVDSSPSEHIPSHYTYALDKRLCFRHNDGSESFVNPNEDTLYSLFEAMHSRVIIGIDSWESGVKMMSSFLRQNDRFISHPNLEPGVELTLAVEEAIKVVKAYVGEKLNLLSPPPSEVITANLYKGPMPDVPETWLNGAAAEFFNGRDALTRGSIGDYFKEELGYQSIDYPSYQRLNYYFEDESITGVDTAATFQFHIKSRRTYTVDGSWTFLEMMEAEDIYKYLVVADTHPEGPNPSHRLEVSLYAKHEGRRHSPIIAAASIHSTDRRDVELPAVAALLRTVSGAAFTAESEQAIRIENDGMGSLLIRGNPLEVLQKLYSCPIFTHFLFREIRSGRNIAVNTELETVNFDLYTDWLAENFCKDYNLPDTLTTKIVDIRHLRKTVTTVDNALTLLRSIDPEAMMSPGLTPLPGAIEAIQSIHTAATAAIATLINSLTEPCDYTPILATPIPPPSPPPTPETVRRARDSWANLIQARGRGNDRETRGRETREVRGTSEVRGASLENLVYDDLSAEQDRNFLDAVAAATGRAEAVPPNPVLHENSWRVPNYLLAPRELAGLRADRDREAVDALEEARRRGPATAIVNPQTARDIQAMQERENARTIREIFDGPAGEIPNLSGRPDDMPDLDDMQAAMTQAWDAAVGDATEVSDSMIDDMLRTDLDRDLAAFDNLIIGPIEPPGSVDQPQAT